MFLIFIILKTIFFLGSYIILLDKKGPIKLSKENIWVKRPGTGKILATDFSKILNKRTKKKILKNTQLSWDLIE